MRIKFGYLLLLGFLIIAALSVGDSVSAFASTAPGSAQTNQLSAAVNDPVDIPDPCTDPNACLDPEVGTDISWWWGTYCAYIPRWALDSVIWAGIAYYGAAGVVGLIADFTVAGLPVGLILGSVSIARGVQLSFALWWVDNYWGAGRRICV